MTDRLMLLDTASLYFRAFYGVPDTIRRADGTPVNAVRGLLDMIARLTTDYGATHLVACWDDDWRPQWRVDLIPSYKSHRVAEVVAGAPDVEVVPDALEAQIPMIRRVLGLAGIAVVGAAEHEADDVIGTYASHAELPVDVVTGDRDLFQVVDDARQVRVIYTARGMKNLEVLTDAVVVDKYRVLPGQYADYATLRGDSLRRAAGRRRHRREDRRVAARRVRHARRAARGCRGRRKRAVHCRAVQARRGGGLPHGRSRRRENRSGPGTADARGGGRSVAPCPRRCAGRA